MRTSKCFCLQHTAIEKTILVGKQKSLTWLILKNLKALSVSVNKLLESYICASCLRHAIFFNFVILDIFCGNLAYLAPLFNFLCGNILIFPRFPIFRRLPIFGKRWPTIFPIWKPKSQLKSYCYCIYHHISIIR